MLAPLLVASTLTLFGRGVALIVVGHGGGLLLTLHAVSFGVWGVISDDDAEDDASAATSATRSRTTHRCNQ